MALQSDRLHADAATRQVSSQRLMADRQSQAGQQNNTYLSQNQQDLLVAALNSQVGARQNNYSPGANTTAAAHRPSSPNSPSDMNTFNDDGLYISPQQATLDDFKQDYSPDLDYLDENFDFDNADLGGEMIGALPGDSSSAELHEKRKNSEEYMDSEEGDAKRQETQDGEKAAKKPGRKPLTSEPTTKRKAQNRAAQRAFRERKEKHLKDLETKVSELTKAKEADKHENGLLKAQVERLQVELREYRKRLSLNSGSGANRSPPATGYGQTRSNSNPSAYVNNFNFDFPKFGTLPGSQMFNNQAYPGAAASSDPRRNAEQSPTNGTIGMPPQSNQDGSRQNSIGPSMSPVSLTGTSTGSPAQTTMFDTTTFATYSTNENMHGFASTLPQMNGANDAFADLFSPGLLKNAGNSSYFASSDANAANAAASSSNLADINGGDSTAGLNRVFQFNSNSSGSDSASPSASSASQWNGNANSSCGTSPEPSHGSPANKATDKVNGLRHQSPLATSNPASSTNNNQFTTPDYSLPSVNAFDPVLFGDYRDSQDAIVGGGDFSGGFFDDALQSFDYNSPSNLFGILQSPQPAQQTLDVGNIAVANAPTPSQTLMAELDKTCDGGDEAPSLTATAQAKPKKVLPDGKFISCNTIWNQLQTNPDFQEGKFDLDSLCSELKTKARCSESGVMVDQDHVDAAIRKLGKKDDKGKVYEGPSGLMFEQDSWDSVLKKLGGPDA